ncbi:MAG: SUMF1/EgtB/PvdO family nonheme iron enzyme, partial [Chloroflexi bacterium]|nr:SUMF1/EgtB/PvdO family nonheme iron enzyme [Chloroflexota bacterium]
MFSANRIVIPPDLAESVARGSCVLFLGADHSLGETGSPTHAQIAAALARKYSLPSGQSLSSAADEFLRQQSRNRNGLVTFLKTQVEFASVHPTDVHHTIVELGFDAVVTTWYDDLLEQAYRAAGKSVACVVRGLDVAYTSGQDAIVVKLYGDIRQPKSLVLTSRDMMLVNGHLAQRLEDVRPYVRLRPIIFVGWDPGEKGPARQLYTTATESLGEHKRRNYIVWPDPTPGDVAWWEEDNVEIIPAEPLPFLRALQQLVRQKRAHQPGYRPGEIVGKLPYKFLNYFDPDDRDIFCGREVEAPLVYRMALSYPLLTLFGQSGVGKTSLLRAGVVPLLLEEGYTYAYVRALGDPLRAIRDGVCNALSIPLLSPSPGGEGESLRDFFCRVLGDQGRMVVVLDQFEELFIRTGKATRKRFWREVGACLGLTNPEVRFVISLREDYVAELDEARRPLSDGEPAPVPNILRNSYRLTSLEADTAYLAIVEPARRARCEVEPQLAELLLGRKTSLPQAGGTEGGQWSLAEADGLIPPPSLQIVMDRLYRQALDRAGLKPPAEGAAGKGWTPPELALTFDLYRELGGAGDILADYVKDALDDVPERGGDRAVAETLLKVLVTSQATKAALNDAEMVAGMAEADPDFDPDDLDDKKLLHATRQALVDLRLLRSFTAASQAGEGALYELAHDYIAAEIATWIDEGEMQTKLVRELLRRELESYRILDKLIEPAALKMIHEQREGLRRLTLDELELLFRSALAAGHEVAYWFERAREGDVPVDNIARDGLKSDNFNTRAAAVAALGELGERFAGPLAEMLKDDYPQVRVAAIHAMERLQPDGAWRERLMYECYVPAGSFIMGDENLAHEVTLDAYYIAKYPVTNAEYKRYRNDVGQPFDAPDGKADHPVTSVSWYDAR